MKLFLNSIVVILIAVIATFGCKGRGQYNDYKKEGAQLLALPPLPRVCNDSTPAPLPSFINPRPFDLAHEYLAAVMDQFHYTFNVYTDADAAGNHFVAKCMMPKDISKDELPPMEERCVDNPKAGISCIKCAYNASNPQEGWGGWYFNIGVLQGDETQPKCNWGDYPNGFDLQGATKLEFWAKGAVGGEWVEFFAFGVGRDSDTGNPITPYYDSERKLTTHYIKLSNDWQKYTLNLNGLDLIKVIGGFGWVSSAYKNNYRDIIFYIDEIKYIFENKYDRPTLDDPRFLVSYQVIQSDLDFDKIFPNTAFTYDNALALLAFLANGSNDRAKLIGDALVYALNHDRYYDVDGLRNAYQGGDLMLFPGWEPNGRKDTVRMPGWTDDDPDNPGGKRWFEDMYQISSGTGNVAWAMLALIAFHQVVVESDPNFPPNERDKYIDAAKRLGNWVHSFCFDDDLYGGYIVGYEGWEPDPDRKNYNSTEHNIDLYVAFQRLFLITGEVQWRERAEHAAMFVTAMWDPVEKKFWTGTKEDGTINKDVVPLDVQAWAVLASKGNIREWWSALDYVENNMKVDCGYDFSNSDGNGNGDGIWWEGTAQMASAYWLIDKIDKYKNIISCLKNAQDKTGGMFAANIDGLTTGFDFPAPPGEDPKPWLYFKRLHVGATAWFVLAKRKINPFWMGYSD